jgi:hypothetical protein
MSAYNNNLPQTGKPGGQPKSTMNISTSGPNGANRVSLQNGNTNSSLKASRASNQIRPSPRGQNEGAGTGQTPSKVVNSVSSLGGGNKDRQGLATSNTGQRRNSNKLNTSKGGAGSEQSPGLPKKSDLSNKTQDKPEKNILKLDVSKAVTDSTIASSKNMGEGPKPKLGDTGKFSGSLKPARPEKGPYDDWNIETVQYLTQKEMVRLVEKLRF